MSNVLPSGLKAKDDTVPETIIGSPIGRPVAASQNRAVLSLPPVAKILPSALKATL